MKLLRTGRAYQHMRLVRNRLVIMSKGLGNLDATAYVHSTSHAATDLCAGPYVFIGPYCEIPPRVVIGKYTMLASNVSFVGDDHNSSRPGVPMQFAGRPQQSETRIGDDVWLGRGVVVMRGVNIGNGAIVGAGAIVTKDVPPYELWAGVPAHRIRDRFLDGAARTVHEDMLSGPLCAPIFAPPLQGRI